MRLILWSMFACSGMRYNACAAVRLGDPCTAEEEGELECTKRPKSDVDINCVETLREDHDIAQCTEQNGEYIWAYYDSCTDGLQAVTDGVNYDCIVSTVYDCDNTIHPDDDWMDE